ncbi:hypothetical protein NESM_000052000 [Novymonas esmeraldas]|uniref:Uncharacterized protein n=1 Tax=Novymonas esmeraldas TaxID=1808958 RepID=A0AAW0F2C5_9TRYP
MEGSSPAASPPVSTRVTVCFASDDALVPVPKSPIGTTDAGGRAPRNPGSRRIQFLDDGKLFEGHFTVQSRNLKSIIQYLMDRQSEQDVIIQDLQKQVHVLRARHLKSNQRMGGGMGLLAAAAASAGGSGGGRDVGDRVKAIEQFLQLWGVRLSEVAELVEEHGDPVITPDAYTSFLLDLPAFRFTRREARAFMTSASQQPAMNAAAAAANDTAARRRNNSNPSKRDTSSAGSSPEPERKKGEDGAAEATLEKANAALEKAETLLAELRSTSARPPPTSTKARRAEAATSEAEKGGRSGGGDRGGGGGGGGTVDNEARADIEELGDYVMRRFQELETQSLMTAAAVARAAAAAAAPRPDKTGGSSSPVAGGAGAGGGGAVAAPAAKVPAVRPKPAPKKATATAAATAAAVPNSTSPTAAQPPQPLPRMPSGEVVDAVAREDAAASLDLIEELEATVERRFKEVNSALASIAVRTAAMAKNNNSNSGAGTAAAEPEKQSQQRSASPAASKAPSSRSHSPSPGKQADKANESKPAVASATEEAETEETHVSPSASHPPPPAAAKAPRPAKGKAKQSASGAAAGVPVTGAGVDTLAREETAALADRVGDLEEELLERWQAMEERLRIIGRAAMKQNAANATAGPGGTAVSAVNRAPVVDRKAREDAALSLMRLQHLEKELAQLKRQWGSAGAAATAATARSAGFGGAGDSGNGSMGEAPPAVLMVSMEPSAPLRDTYGSKVADLEKEVEQRMAEVNQAIAQLRGTASMTPSGRDGDGGGGFGGFGTAMAAATRVTDSSGRVDALSDLHPLAWTAGLAAPLGGAAILPDQPQVNRTAAVSASSSPAAPQGPSNLTLRAVDLDAAAGAAPTESRVQDVSPAQRAAVQQSLLTLGHLAGSDAELFSLFPKSGYSPGARRTTISRLRSPDAPTFGSHLVQRAVVDLPADALVEDGLLNAAGQRASVLGSGAAAAPPAADAQHGGGVRGAVANLDGRTFSVPAPPGAPKGSIARVRLSEVRDVSPTAAAAASPNAPNAPRSHRRETLGHTEPCLVMNCAWCDAEKSAEPTAT